MYELSPREIEVLRSLASEYAALAALPQQQETIRLWKCLNGLRPERPMATIDQLPWNELDTDGSLTNLVEEPFFRSVETFFRQTLYQWKHFPADMVVMPWVPIPMSIHSTGWSDLVTEMKIVETDPTNSVVSHEYIPSFHGWEDLDKFRDPVITLDEADNTARRQAAEAVFGGILPVRMVGQSTMYHPWDYLCGIIGITESLELLLDDPDLAHALCRKMHSALVSEMNQLEAIGGLESPQPLIHCTGAHSDELPKSGYNPARPRPIDVWTAGMSQPFVNVSPAMHKEFDLDYSREYYKNFGLVYYGCCEPLSDRIELIRTIPNIRKISCSPWSNVRVQAYKQGKDVVLSRKPNPAYLAPQSADLDSAMQQIQETLDACRENGTPCELILKDVSTVHYQPERLVEWNRRVMNLIRK